MLRIVFPICLACVALSSANNITENLSFEKPRYAVSPSEIPQLFRSRLTDHDLQSYPLAVEAVISVALKLQAIQNNGGKQQNFLVSPLAVASALGQLMLGARGNLRRQIGVLLTLHETTPDTATVSPAAIVQQRFGLDTATVQQGLLNPTDLRSTKGSENVASQPLQNTVSAQNAWSYEQQVIKMPHFAAKSRDGLPGLELHRQLGRLINYVTNPLPGSGAVHSLANSSYLHTSSAFFVDHNLNLNEPFVRAIIDFYNSKVVPLNFRSNPVEAQNVVNRWGSTETGGLIDQFLPYPPKPDTAVIQAVAIHFRGAWQTPFIEGATVPGFFKTSETTTVPVNFMRTSLEEAFYAEDKTLGLRLLAMPYSNYDCAMYVFLPTEDNPLKYNIGHLVTQMTSKNFADLVGMTKQRTVNVMFPKLSLTQSLSLASALEEHASFLTKLKRRRSNSTVSNAVPSPIPPSAATGAPTLVESINIVNPQTGWRPSLQEPNDQLRVIPLNGPLPSQVSEKLSQNVPQGSVNASVPSAPVGNDDSGTPHQKPTLTLTGAASNSQFRISDIIQQVALEVNESGTEAAAIAGSTINYSGDVKNFKVNRPFLFFIRHEATNAILFWGTIADPTA
ncbi:serine protease inhibitor 28Dc-like [Athalia rosae]|uniref:serine protease inhibitor 28Dc-like n=1 Tax=Athalia rosae TaxID=37344 RepID=UPI0020346D08|nr:serine protease inhibitor 28Dc-like [Athalia rosae]